MSNAENVIKKDISLRIVIVIIDLTAITTTIIIDEIIIIKIAIGVENQII